MALRAAFAAQNLNINAEPVRDAVSSLVPNGGGLVQAGDYAVTQTGTASMAVVAGVGRIWVPGTAVANLSGQTWGTQGQYQITNDAPYTMTIGTADSTNPRIDVVYVGMQDSQYAGSSNGPVLAVAQGAPVAGATYPANAPAIPANSIALAWVLVGANVTSIVTGNITQLATAGFAPKPIVRAANPAFGSSSGLLANLTSGSITPIIQCGSDIKTTASNGSASITFPQSFPNGVITVTAVNGDEAAAAGYTVQVNEAGVALTGFGFFATIGSTVTPLNGTIRVNWIAIGW